METKNTGQIFINWLDTDNNQDKINKAFARRKPDPSKVTELFIEWGDFVKDEYLKFVVEQKISEIQSQIEDLKVDDFLEYGYPKGEMDKQVLHYEQRINLLKSLL